MRRVLAVLTVFAISACGGSADKGAAGDTGMAAMSAMSGTLSLGELAGTWNMKAMTASGDSTLVAYTMTATADAGGWTMNFPGRDPIPMQVSTAGDSLVFDAGPYASALRADSEMVTVHGSSRLQDGTMVGTFTAHYATTRPDSVLMGRLEGMRAP